MKTYDVFFEYTVGNGEKDPWGPSPVAHVTVDALDTIDLSDKIQTKLQHLMDRRPVIVTRARRVAYDELIRALGNVLEAYDHLDACDPTLAPTPRSNELFAQHVAEARALLKMART